MCVAIKAQIFSATRFVYRTPRRAKIFLRRPENAYARITMTAVAVSAGDTG